MIRRFFAICILALFSSGCSSLASSTIGFGRTIIGLFSEDDASFAFENSSDLTQEEEYWLGRSVAGQIFTLYRPSTDPKLHHYISQVGLAVSKFSERPELFGGYSFQILESEQMNALSAPGGYIFITTGLLYQLRSEDELAAVLAHEIAHVQEKHGLSAINTAQRNKGVSLGGKIAGALHCSEAVQLINLAFESAVTDIVLALTEKGFSRQQEYDADAIALDILTKAGYDPSALVKALQTLQGTQSHGGWFATHPSPIDRLDQLGPIPSQDAPADPRIKRYRAAMKF